jgi:hypothetical protein
MKKTMINAKVVDGIPTELFVPVGGFAMSFVNKYVKMAAYDVWSYVSKRGKYDISQCENINTMDPPLSKEDDNIFSYWVKYNTWHILYDAKNNPFNAYLCTQKGFFNINLCYWSILKGMPSKTPQLSESLKTIYETLNQKMTSSASEGDILCLEKVQIICLFNLIIKDLITIIENIGNGIKSKIPILFKRILKHLNTLNNSDEIYEILEIKKKINASIEECTEAKSFLDKYSKNPIIAQELFYRNNIPNKQEKIRIIGNLGMYFDYNINNIFVLSIADSLRDNKFLKETALMSGKWKKAFKIQYHILLL